MLPGRARPRPGVPEGMRRRQAGGLITAPAAGKHAVEHLAVQFAPVIWERFVATDDAVEGQNQRHGGGLLQARTPGDLGGKILAPLWLVFEPAADEGFHVLGIAQWLKLAHAVGIVCVINGELLIP